MPSSRPWVTWREFEQHQQAFAQLSARLDVIDSQGTRGVGVVQVQVTELTKDVGDLKTAVERWQTRHEGEHAQEAASRVTGRRWVIGTSIAALAAMVALITMVGALLAHTVP